MSLSEMLRVDPLPALLASGDPALAFFVRRDLLGEDPGSVERLWDQPAARRLLAKQQVDGPWRYPGQNRERFPEINYDLLETFRSLGVLAGKYGLDRRHPALAAAAEYVFSCQAEEGDLRGILGTQHMPYYHGVLLELLIRAGYAADPRVERGLEWLVSVRQEDGGWIVPAQQALPAREKTRELWNGPPLPPDRTRPFSHLATGMALRAFAVHADYKRHPAALAAAGLLKSRFFRADKYNDRKAPLYWTKFQYPFWWPNLITGLDCLSRLGFTSEDPAVQRGLDWFVAHQGAGGSGKVLPGLWPTGYEQKKRSELSDREVTAQQWVGLAICRVLIKIGPVSQTGPI